MKSISNKQILFTLIGALVASFAQPARAEQAHRPLAKPQTWCSYNGPGEQRRRAVITDSRAFQEAWETAHRRVSPAPALPSVDFSENQVVALYRGGQPSGGYGISLTALEQVGEEVRVYVKETSPQPGRFYTQSLTSPLCFAVVPKSAALSFVDAE